MRYFVIPARKHSKGFPFKNRVLLDYTLNSIPKVFHKDIIITTDDEVIIDKVKGTNITVLKRDESLAGDDISIKAVLIDVIQKCNLKDDDDIIKLYLTYPQRTFEDIETAYNFYKANNAKSLLCAKKIKYHPYKCFYKKENHRGKCIIDHDLYRRQAYPECFVANHYISICKVEELKNLKNNLYSDGTIFYDINDFIDIDTKEDYLKFIA